MEEKKIALLIDAENISYKNSKQIIEKMKEKGNLIVKCVVADWTKITGAKRTQINKQTCRDYQIEGWRKESNTYSLTPIQQFSYVSGKNATDLALTIEAMKILYEKPYITTFCLVSNDSDFTRLAQELREHDKEVIGMGESDKAIEEFRNAFDEFYYLGEGMEEEEDKTPEKKPKSKHHDRVLPKVQFEYLKQLIEDRIAEDGIAYYSYISATMKKQFSDFVPENYGSKNVSGLIQKLLPYLKEYKEVKEPIPNNPTGFVMMLKKIKK